MTATSLQRARTGEGTRPAVEIHGLVKTFGRTRALAGLDLTVAPGDVTGFLGTGARTNDKAATNAVSTSGKECR